VAPSGTGPGRSTRCGRWSQPRPTIYASNYAGSRSPSRCAKPRRYARGGRSDVTAATRLALRTLARRVLELDTEVAALDDVLEPVVAATRSRTGRPGRCRHRHRRRPARRRRTEHKPSPHRTLRRPALRRRSTRRVIRQATTTPTQPRGRPPSSALWRIVISRLSHDPTPGATSYAGSPTARPNRSHPLPQALRRTRALLPAPPRTTGLTPHRSINLFACRETPLPQSLA
jgi:hypothetical protein